MISVEVVRAWPRRHESVRVELPAGATVGDAVAAAGWEAWPEGDAVAVHGARTSRDATVEDGDRVELLRALLADPKEARRRRAAAR